MAKRVSVIGGCVAGLTTAYTLIREGFDEEVIDARPDLGSQAGFANGGQLSCRYVAPLADAGVPIKRFAEDSPLKLRLRMDSKQ